MYLKCLSFFLAHPVYKYADDTQYANYVMKYSNRDLLAKVTKNLSHNNDNDNDNDNNKCFIKHKCIQGFS